MDFELRRMDLWEKVIPGFKYSKETPFFEMVVPTVDTVRYGYLLEKLLAVKQSVLYTGNTGVGKVSGQTSLNLTKVQFEPLHHAIIFLISGKDRGMPFPTVYIDQLCS